MAVPDALQVVPVLPGRQLQPVHAGDCAVRREDSGGGEVTQIDDRLFAHLRWMATDTSDFGDELYDLWRELYPEDPVYCPRNTCAHWNEHHPGPCTPRIREEAK